MNNFKKNAFRDKIRRNYIDKIFHERRIEFDKQIVEKKSFLLSSEDMNSQQTTNNNSNLNIQQLQQLLQLLPRSIGRIVQITNNHPVRARQIILMDNLQKITSTFSETSLVQWSSYVYLIQGMLVQREQHTPERINLIQTTSGPVLYKANKLCQQNKMAQVNILRNYFDYLVTIGQDLVFLDSLDMITIHHNIKRVLLQICTPEQVKPGDQSEDLLNSVILLCHNIVSLRPNVLNQQKMTNITPQNQSKKICQQSVTNKMDKQYECQHMKVMFLNQLFKHPNTIGNLTEFGCDIQLPLQCQQILRFLINLTYILNESPQLKKIQKHLIILIQSILAQVKNNSYQINILVLRLINNVAVSDVYFCMKIAQESILGMMLKIFGANYLDNLRKSEVEEFDIGIQREFISTLASYILMAQNQKQLLRYLINKYQVLTMILESMKNFKYFHDNQILVRCLEVILIYMNINQKVNELGQYKQLFQQIIQSTQSLNEQNHAKTWKNNQKQTVFTLTDQILNVIGKSTEEVL